MIKRALVGLLGAAIGALLGSTIAAFTGWNLAIVILAILFGLLAVWTSERRGTVPTVGDLNRPTTLFPTDQDKKP
jgi:MFS family permease